MSYMLIETVLWTKILMNSKPYEFIRFSIIISWIKDMSCYVLLDRVLMERVGGWN